VTSLASDLLARVMGIHFQGANTAMEIFCIIRKMDKERFKEGFEHKSKRKIPMIKSGTTGQERRHTQGKNTMGRN
jgi:hypothetical protein